MDRLSERIAKAERALARLTEVASIGHPTAIERDAAIVRFAFAFETVWKAARGPGGAARPGAAGLGVTKIDHSRKSCCRLAHRRAGSGSAGHGR